MRLINLDKKFIFSNLLWRCELRLLLLLLFFIYSNQDVGSGFLTRKLPYLLQEFQRNILNIANFPLLHRSQDSYKDSNNNDWWPEHGFIQYYFHVI